MNSLQFLQTEPQTTGRIIPKWKQMLALELYCTVGRTETSQAPGKHCAFCFLAVTFASGDFFMSWSVDGLSDFYFDNISSLLLPSP